jgi:hypothetical protein
VNSNLVGLVPAPAWIRSTYSNGAGGECVECARVGDEVLVRDTKVGDELVAHLGSQAWLSFIRATGQGWSDAVG